jgi:hypothetical protein
MTRSSTSRCASAAAFLADNSAALERRRREESDEDGRSVADQPEVMRAALDRERAEIDNSVWLRSWSPVSRP